MCGYQKTQKNLTFDIVYVQRIKHNDWVHEGVDIRVEIGANDCEFWSAWIEPIDEYPGTCIIIHGQSRSSAYDQVKSYHKKK